MLKFITEEYLKGIYRKMPFEEYFLGKDEKLTPSGSEFLRDKHIKLSLNEKEKINNKKQNEKIDEIEEKREKIGNMKIAVKTKMAMFLFYKTGNSYLVENINLAKKIIIIGKLLENLKKYFEGRIYNLEIDSRLRKEDLSTVELEIDDVYIYQEKNLKLLELYYLSSVIEELDYLIEEEIGNDNELKKYINTILGMISVIIKESIKGEKFEE